MASKVEFQDFRIEVMDAIDDRAVAKLYEAIGELEAQVKRDTPDRGRWFTELEQSWNHTVDEGELEATVGSRLERSLWSEFGTGEYSIAPKGGRQGYWIYVKGNDLNDSGGYVYKGGKQYTLEDAKRIVAMMRDEGLDAYYTKGQRPNRTLHNAFVKMKPKIIKLFEGGFKDL